jgi:DnaJ like chaperone protein
MPDKGKILRDGFFKAVFSFLGYVAQCDGAVNRDEVYRLKVHMKKMALSEEEQRSALVLFKAGAAPEFGASVALQEFRATTTPKLIQILLMHLLAMARADGYLVEKELNALRWIAGELGYKSITFNHLLKIIFEQDQLALSRNSANPTATTTNNTQTTANQTSANGSDTYSAQSASQARAQTQTYSQSQNQNQNQNQKKAQQQSQQQANSADNKPAMDAIINRDLQKAYKILGVNAGMTEDEMRQAYKKLASQLHPDKLLSQNLPPEQLNAATEQFKRVQVAYAFIKKYRSMYSAKSV